MDDGCSVQARARLCLSEHFVHRSHSFFSHLSDPVRWLTRRSEDPMALEPLSPGVLLQKSQIKGLGSIKSGHSGGVFDNNVQLGNY